MAIAKLRTIKIMLGVRHTKKPIAGQLAKATKARTRPKRKPRSTAAKQQPKTRSLLMHNLLKPRLQPLAKAQTKGGAKRHRLTRAYGLLVDDKSVKRAKKPSKTTKPLKPLKKATFPRMQSGMAEPAVPRRPSSLISPQSLLPHMGAGIPKKDYGTFGYQAATPLRPAQKNAVLEVPLTTRLPIIDFISTDEFERLLITKKKPRKKLLADPKMPKSIDR